MARRNEIRFQRELLYQHLLEHYIRFSYTGTDMEKNWMKPIKFSVTWSTESTLQFKRFKARAIEGFNRIKRPPQQLVDIIAEKRLVFHYFPYRIFLPFNGFKVRVIEDSIMMKDLPEQYFRFC